MNHSITCLSGGCWEETQVCSLTPRIWNLLRHQLMVCGSEEVQNVFPTCYLHFYKHSGKRTSISSMKYIWKELGVAFGGLFLVLIWGFFLEFFWLLFEYTEDVAFLSLLQVTGWQQSLSLAVTPGDFGVPELCSSSAGAASGACSADPWQWMEYFSSFLCQDEPGWLWHSKS